MLSGKNKSDYTEESWNALQQVITEAEKITKKEDYEAIKPKLTSESLVPINFEKSELIDLLAELVGKTEENYTEESWEELQSAIETARNTDLKSEYDQVKNKLTLETLKEINEDNEEGTLSKLMGILQEHYILVIASVIGLIIIIILIIVICKKSKKKESRWSK